MKMGQSAGAAMGVLPDLRCCYGGPLRPQVLLWGSSQTSGAAMGGPPRPQVLLWGSSQTSGAAMGGPPRPQVLLWGSFQTSGAPMGGPPRPQVLPWGVLPDLRCYGESSQTCAFSDLPLIDLLFITITLIASVHPKYAR